jgi:hypothetical protein
MRLSDGQRNTLVRFLTNAGTIALGGLIFGPFISQQPFRPRVFAVGTLLYAAFLGAAPWLSQEEKGERE